MEDEDRCSTSFEIYHLRKAHKTSSFLHRRAEEDRTFISLLDRDIRSETKKEGPKMESIAFSAGRDNGRRSEKRQTILEPSRRRGVCGRP